MDVAELVLRYVEVLVWPVTVTILLFAYHDAIIAILPNSKIKVSLYGFEIETTLQELKDVTLATLGGDLSSWQRNLLEEIAKEGPKSFERGEIPKEDRKWIRPIMNAGLIMTQPAEAHLGDAKGLALTPLGKLLVSSAVQGINFLQDHE